MKLQRGCSYMLSKLKLIGWSTPVGFRETMEGYLMGEYFDGLSGCAIYLGPDTFGVEPLFEVL